MAIILEVKNDQILVFDGEKVVYTEHLLSGKAGKMKRVRKSCKNGQYAEFKPRQIVWLKCLHDGKSANRELYEPLRVHPLGFDRQEEKRIQLLAVQAYTEAHSPSFDEVSQALDDDEDAKEEKSWFFAVERLYWPKTLEELHQEFHVIGSDWRRSAHYDNFVSQIQSLKSSTKVPITNVITFGTGSLHAVHGDSNNVGTVSARQLTAVITMSQLLGGPGNPLPCIAQELDYSECEKRFLRTIGLQVVEHPDAFSLIDGGSLVFHTGTSLSMAWHISQAVWPAAMICNDRPPPSPISSPNNTPKSHAQYVRFMFQQYVREPFLTVGHEDDPVARRRVYLFRLKRSFTA